jgi:glutathione S-transferase
LRNYVLTECSICCAKRKNKIDHGIGPGDFEMTDRPEPGMSDRSELLLYGLELSGHTHRVVLLLEMLGLSYRFVPAPAQVRQSPEFLRLNPLGQIPVLLDGTVALPDSNAILVYLAKRYAADTQWLPTDAIAASKVQRWLSIAAGEIRYGPGIARAKVLWDVPGDRDGAIETAARVLRFMEVHLNERAQASGECYIATDYPTIADLACYSYVAHAPEGGISLAPYPAIRSWLARVERLPRFKPMPSSPAKI